jgi:hypothetical protein
VVLSNRWKAADAMKRENLPIAWLGAPLFAATLLLSAECASAKGTGLVFVANEKSSTITILDAAHNVVESFATCGRPRGMHFTADRSGFFLACGDDDTIALRHRDAQAHQAFLRHPDPETFDLHPDAAISRLQRG